jgi:hypothetical protein
MSSRASATTSWPELGDLPPNGLDLLVRDGLDHVQVAVAPRPRHRRPFPDEPPINGEDAVARWLALYDRARDLRAALHAGDGVGQRHALRAIRSLFLYEHQLTAKTRRQARTMLWRRDRRESLPAFTERSRWARCRCAHCQPEVHRVLEGQFATRAQPPLQTLLQSA